MCEYESVERLCKRLNLPEGEPHTQDWAYELPKEYRTVAYFKKYIDAYQRPEYNESDMKLLMQLMLDMANDFIDFEEEISDTLLNTMLGLLKEEKELHQDLIEHWILEGEPLENTYSITPLIRDLFNKAKVKVPLRKCS